MDEIIKTIDALVAQCDGLENMEQEAVEELLGSLQECFIDLLGAEPKKAKKEAHKRWKGKLKALNEAPPAPQAHAASAPGSGWECPNRKR